MATTSESADTFLLGLSDFWLRFFKDRPQLEALYEGTEILIGQAYLDMVSQVLSLSVRETPVYQKSFFKLLVIREDHLIYRPATDNWGVEVTDERLKDAPFIQNKIFAPTSVMQRDSDYHFDTEGAEDYLVFPTNIFDWGGTGETIPGYGFRTVRVGGTTQRQISFWLVDAQNDNFDMYLKYGYLLNRFEPSSEAYRALLQGVMQYFVLGPTEQYLTSAMNVIMGLPTIRDDGEVLQSVDYSDSRYNYVVTDKRGYQFDKEIPLRADVEDTSNWGTLTFDALEAVTTVFTVYDSVNDPVWWYDTTIPTRVLPNEPRARRVIDPNLYENIVGYPIGRTKIGDPGLFIGADDDGFVPWVNPSNPALGLKRPTYRHLFSYIVFERFLNLHTFTIVFDSALLYSGSIPFNRLDLDLQQIILAGKSAYTTLYLEPGIVLTDTVVLPLDEFEIFPKLGLEETIGTIDGGLTIGLKSHAVGDYYKYASGVLTIQNESTDPDEAPLRTGQAAVFGLGGDATLVDVGKNVFSGADMNRWIYREDINQYYQITGAETPQQIRVTPNVVNPPVEANWRFPRFKDGWTPATVGGSDPHHTGKLLASEVNGVFGFGGNDYQLRVLTAVFDESDVGKWVYRIDTEEYYQIDEFIDVANVLLTRRVSDAPATADWELYKYENGKDMVEQLDWPLQLRIP
jgi:hypothetical protein